MIDIEKVKDKWLVCSTPKHGYAYNSLLFWGKNDCGHYANLEKCEFYTEEEAKARCYGSKCVAIPVKELIPYMTTQIVGASSILSKYQEKKEEVNV